MPVDACGRSRAQRGGDHGRRGTSCPPGGAPGDHDASHVSPTSAQGAAPYHMAGGAARSEEHTSELQSQSNLVCRLLLEKKKKDETTMSSTQAGRTCVTG